MSIEAHDKAYKVFQSKFGEDLSKGKNKKSLTTNFFVERMNNYKSDGQLDKFDHPEGTPTVLQNY